MLLGGVWVATDPHTETRRVTVPQYVLLPYIPFGLAMVTTVTAYFVTGEVDAVTVFGFSALVMLVLSRQLTVVRENTTLNTRLAATVAQLRRREEELEHRAYHDALTNLPNRARFHARVEEAIAEHGTDVIVLYVDLDGFKAINDEHGHDVGDALLVAVADRLRDAVDPARHELVARLGGDEFAVLLPAVSSPEVGTALADRIVSSIAAVRNVGTHPVRIGASVGIAVNQDERRVGELLRAADLAMYAAKMEGKGRYALVGSAIAAAAGPSAPAADADRHGAGNPGQAADSSAAPNETWNRAHQIETLVSVSRSTSAGTG